MYQDFKLYQNSKRDDIKFMINEKSSMSTTLSETVEKFTSNRTWQSTQIEIIHSNLTWNFTSFSNFPNLFYYYNNILLG